MGNREQGIRDINCFWDIAVFWINVSLKKKKKNPFNPLHGKV